MGFAFTRQSARWICGALLLPGSLMASPRDAKPSIDNKACYEGFAEHVARLSDEGVVDCGFFEDGGTDKEREGARRCMRKASRANRPFRVGSISSEARPLYCGMLFSDRHGSVVSLRYHRDSPFWGNTGVGRLWVQRCHDIVLSEDERGRLRFNFGVDDCSYGGDLLPDVFEGVLDNELSSGEAEVRALPK